MKVVPMPRDPKIEPQKGDVLEKMRRGYLFERRVRAVSDDILYQDSYNQVCASSKAAWRRWAKNADVVHHAG